jgi:hypothetical protein
LPSSVEAPSSVAEPASEVARNRVTVPAPSAALTSSAEHAPITRRTEEGPAARDAAKRDEPAAKTVDAPSKADKDKRHDAAPKAADKDRRHDAAPKVEKVDAAKAAPVDDDAPPPSHRSGSHDMESGDFSLTSEFFRKQEDSVPPVGSVAEHDRDHGDHDDVHPMVVLSPSAIARRARLRRVVGGVVIALGLVSVAVIGKALSSSKGPEIAANDHPTVVETAKKVEAAPAPPPAPAEATAKPAEAPPPAAEASAAPEASVAPEASAPPATEPAAAPTTEPSAKPQEEPPKAAGDAAALTKEAYVLLNRGKRKEAIEAAKASIAADPSDALPYLYLGSALQETGKWKDGQDAYNECVRHATRGPVYECRAMGGRK